MPKVHYKVEVIGGCDPDHILYGPACGYNTRGKLSENHSEVNCKTCRELCGFEDN
jgi:hypothetical protein